MVMHRTIKSWTDIRRFDVVSRPYTSTSFLRSSGTSQGIFRQLGHSDDYVGLNFGSNLASAMFASNR